MTIKKEGAVSKAFEEAFEITKNVTESNAETLLNVRSGGVVGELGKEIEQLHAEKEKYRVVLEEIKDWANAYPLKVFPKPDLEKAKKVLKAAGMTLDAISAEAMRHVLNTIENTVLQALKGERKCST